MDRVLATFDKVLAFLESGDLFRKPLKWIFYALGALFSIGLLILIVRSFEIMRFLPANGVIALVLADIVLLGAMAFSGLYWFKRAAKANEAADESSKFVAVPAVSTLIRCLGEYFGIIIGVFFTVIVILVTIFGAGRAMDVPIVTIITLPILGFLTILVSRVIAELYVALIRIADDVRRISNK